MAGEDFETVQSSSYLGANVNSANDISEEVRNRVMCGSRSHYALGMILRRKNLGRVTLASLPFTSPTAYDGSDILRG